MPTYRLPELSYDYGALEPHISGKIMELHHKQHHAAYVKGANTALEQLDEARLKQDFSRLPALEKALAFHLSGHILHSLFWKNLTPNAVPEPSGALAETMKKDFGDFAAFKAQFNEVAGSIMGSGWAALIWEPLAQKLLVTQIYDHQSNLSQGGVPIMVLDAWEHAYYLQYQNKKKDFFAAVWNIWNWQDIAERFQAVRSIDLHAQTK